MKDEKGSAISRIRLLLLLSFLGVFLTSMSVALATHGSTGIRVSGDLPNDGVNYNLTAYNASQTSPCDGNADAATDLKILNTSLSGASGDSTFDDNNDYNVTTNYSLSPSPTMGFFYFCGNPGSTGRANVSFAVANGDDIELDLGKISAGTAFHDDLADLFVFVCNNTINGGAQLNSSAMVTAATTGYTQYYPMVNGRAGITDNGGNQRDVFILFRNNTAGVCQFDNSVKAGKRINTDVSTNGENYGVDVTFEPDTKASGDLHTDLSGVILELLDNAVGNTSVGLANQSGVIPSQTPDGLNDSTDDYDIYYDNPSGTLNFLINGTDPTAASETNITRAVGLANGFTDQDFTVKVTGAAPTQIVNIKTNFTSTVITNTTLSGTSWTMYIPDNVTLAENASFRFNFSIAMDGATNFTAVKTVGNQSITAGVYDTGINVSRYFGEVHRDLKNGTDDVVSVYSDANCTTAQASTATVNPYENASGNDYEIFFEHELGNDTYYVNATSLNNTIAWYSCGNAFNVARATSTNVSLNMLLTGYVPSTINQIAIEKNTTDTGSGVPHTVNTTSVLPADGLYKVFLPNDTDNTAYALFYQGGTLRLNRSISLGGPEASSNITINVTRISGEVHRDLKNNTDDLVTVHNSSICAAGGTLLSSQTVNPADAAADVDYNQYFEQRVSITSYYVNFTAVSDSAARVYSSCQNLTVTTTAAATNVNVSAIIRVNGSIATDLDSVTIDIDGDNTPEVNSTENTGGSFSLYMVNDTDTTTWIRFGRGGNITLDISGRNFGNGSNADVNNTINVSKISGALDAAFAVAGSGEGLRVIADWNVTPAVNYSNRWNVTNAGTGAAGSEDYWVYFQHQIVDGVATTIYDIEFNESTSSVNRTFFWNNTQTINAGDSYDLDLLNRINGTVPSDLVQIRVSTNNTIVDVAVPNITAVGLVESGGTFSIYSPDIVAINGSFGFANRTVVTLRAQRPAQITVLINNTQLNITADREFNISKLRGDIPIPLAGDTFEIDFNVSNVCSDGNSAYSSNTTSSSPYTLNASEDFALYFEAAPRTYFWLVCDSAALRLNRTISATATSGTETRNVSQISGELHPSLDNGGAANNTNIRISNSTDCATIISSQNITLLAAADAVDYNQTYESTNPTQILYVNVTGNSSLANSGGAVVGQAFYSCVNATVASGVTTVTGGENLNVSILTMVEGNVTFPVKRISVNVTGTGAQNLNDSYIEIVNGSRYFYLFTPAGDAGSDMAAWNITGGASQLLLSRERDLSSSAGAANVSFNVSAISGSLHADLDDQANDDIQVFGGANCADRISSQDIASSGANYIQYFETTATGVLYLNVTNNDGTNNYTTCINTTNTKPQAGFNATDYNVNRRVQGNATTAVGYAVIVPDQQGNQVLEVNSTVVGTTPRSYRAYFSSDAASDILFYNTSNSLILNRTARTFDADAVVNVSRLIGDVHIDLATDVNDIIEVYNNTACAGRGATALLSSTTVNPVSNSGEDNDFTIYFEGYDGPTYYINATAVFGDGRQYITCGNSFIPILHDNVTSPERRIFGILPNASLWNMTLIVANGNVSSTNITSVGINFKSGTGDDANQSTNITDPSVNRYYLYVNSSASSGVELSFYNYTAGGKTTMLNLTAVDLSADTGRNVSKVVGKVDTSLEDGTDTITVCSDASCSTTLSTRTTNPSAFTGIMDYEIYYNHSSATTQNYTMNISDVNGSFVLRSYLRFIPVSITDNGGDTRLINLTRVFGTTREEANSNAIGNVNVTAFVNGNGTIINSSTISNTSGNFFLYLDIGTHEINSSSTGLITGTTDVTVAGATGFDPLVLYVLKITVRDPTGNPINATVNVTNNTGSTWTSYDTYNASNASAGGGVYYFNISSTTYSRVNITVKEPGFSTIRDPDPQFTGDPISLSAIVQTARVYNMTRIENLVAPTLTGPPNGFYNNSNITFTWNAVDGASQYEFQLDDSSDFSSTTNATNTTATSIRTGLTLTDGLYYWRVRALSGINTGGAWSEVRTATFDTTNPGATINAPSARTNSSADTISISADATDAAAGVANVTFYSGGCGTTQIGIVSSAPWQLVWNVTVADDGSKTLCARATDKAGNTGDSATVVIIVDHTRPNATITSPTAGARLNGTVNIQTRVNDSLANISRVDLLIDGSIVQTNTSRTNFPSNADTTFSWDTNSVGDGGHLISIVAYDTANNTNQTIAVSVVVDNGAPDNILITFPINNTYVNDTLTITASASDAVNLTRVEFYNYSTLITNDTSAPWQAAWVTGPNGLAQLYATAYDERNNRLNSSIITVTVDNTAPTLTIQEPVSGTTIYRKAGGVVDVDYTYTEVNVDKVEINVSNSTTTVGSKTITSGLTSGTDIVRNDSVTINNGAPDGTYNVSVRVIDKTGKSVTTTVAQIVVVDTTQPTVSISSPTTGPINGTVTFTLSVSDTGGAGVWKTELYASGANVSINSTTSPFDRLTLNTNTLADGAYTIFAKAYDNSGNTRDSISVNLTVDNTVPSNLFISFPLNNTYVNDTVVIVASASDAISVNRVEFYNYSTLITNDTSAPWQAAWVTGPDGLAQLYVTAYDNNNNRLNSSIISVTVDNTAPTVTVQDPASGTTVYKKASDVVDVDYTYTEVNVDKVEINVSNSTLTVSSKTITSGLTSGTSITRNDSTNLNSGAPEGTYNVSVRVIDKAGRSATTTVAQIVVVDNTAPTVSISSPLTGVISGTQTFTLSLSDSGGSSVRKTELYVDGANVSINSTTSPYDRLTLDTTTIADGAHTIIARAYDNSGNTRDSLSANLTIDNGPPQAVVITTPVNASYINGSTAIEVSVADAASLNRVEFYNFSTLILNDTAAPWQANWDTTAAGGDGVKQIYATVYDNGSNRLNSTVRFVTVDNTAPTVTIQYPTATVYKKSGEALSVNYIYTETNPDKVQINVSNNSHTAGGGTFSTELVSGASVTRNDSVIINPTALEGTYNVTAVILDRVSQRAASSSTQIVVVDNTAPTVTISSPTTGTINGTVTFVLSVSDTGGAGVWKTELYANGANVSINSTTSPYDRLTLGTATLADGAYTFIAKAYDNSGNTRDSISVNLTIDNTGPYSIVITSPAVNGTYVTGTAVGIEASVGDAINVSRVEFYNGSTADSRNLIANDTNNAPWLATWDTTGVNGIQELFATVYDNVNNRLNSSVRSVVVDNTAPATPTINWPANNSNVSGTVTINITATDANSGIAAVEVYDNGTFIGNMTSEPFQLQWITTNFADGVHNITARAIDKVGQRTYSGLLYFVRVSNGKAVTVSVTSPANNTYHNGTITIVAQASAVLGVNRVEFYNGSTSDTRNLIGTDETSPFSITWNTANAVDGTYSLIARVLDNNATATAAESIAITITTDNTAPTVTVQYPTATVYKKAGDTLSVNYIYTETNPSAIQINVSNNSHPAGEATFSTGLISGTSITRNDSVIINPTVLEGTYNVTAVVTDRVSQRGTGSSTQIVVIDNSAPSASITSPAPGANVSGSISIATSISDVGSAGIERVEFFVDGGLHLTNRTSPYGFTLNTTQFLDGIHTLSLRAYDNANNSVQTAPINVTVINKVPTVNITFPQNSSATGTTVTLQAVTDVDATCNYATNTGTTFAQMANTGRTVHYQSLTGLSAGTNNATIHCRNWADSYGSNVTVTWTVDTSGPQVATVFALSPTNSDKVNGTLNINATVSYSGPNGNIGGAEYYIAVYPTIPSSTPNGTLNATDGTFSTTQEDVTGRISLSGRSDDTYWICVIANTSNSLRGPKSCSTPFTLDTVLPIIRMYTPINNTNTSDTTPTITFSIEDARTGVNLSAINVTNGTSGATLSGFSSAACSAVDYGANGAVQKYNCTFDSNALADGHGINITVVARDNSWNQHNNNTNVTVNSTTAVTARLNTSDVVAIADGTYENGWSFTFNITLGSSTSNLTSVNATAVKIANWTKVGGTETIVTTGNTRMNYTDASGTARTYYVSHDYNASDTIYPLRDGDTQSVPINGTVTIFIKIPSSTLAGSYSTTFTFGSWVVPLTGGSPT